MKKAALIFVLVITLILTACGGSNAGENAGEKPAERVLVYEIEDMLGCWYGTEANGDKWLIRVFADMNADGVTYRFTMNAYDGSKSQNLYGDVYLNTDTWEDGETSTSCTMIASLVGGEYDEQGKLGACLMFDDGSFTYRPIEYITLDDGSVTSGINEEKEIRFTREFFAHELKIERTEGALSGVWFVRDGEDTAVIEMYADGTFYIKSEGESGIGVYTLDGDTVALTIKMIDGEEYTNDDATITVTLTEENDLLAENGTLMYALQGGISAKYDTLLKEYTLELCENGLFYMTRGDSEVVGVYMEDASGYTMYALCGGGYVENETCIAEITGEDTLSFYFASEGDDNKMMFTKTK